MRLAYGNTKRRLRQRKTSALSTTGRMAQCKRPLPSLFPCNGERPESERFINDADIEEVMARFYKPYINLYIRLYIYRKSKRSPVKGYAAVFPAVLELHTRFYRYTDTCAHIRESHTRSMP